MSPARRHREGDEGGLRAGDRHRADPLGGVHPGRLHARASPGRLYQQFALTIAISVLHLGLQRADALAGALGAAAQAARAGARVRSAASSPASTAASSATTNGYVQPGTALRPQAARRDLLLLGAARRGAAACCSAGGCPTGFIPDEDQGYLFVNVQLPRRGLAGAHRRGLPAGRGDPREDAGRRATTTPIGGYSLVAQSYGHLQRLLLRALKPWDERHDARDSTSRRDHARR